MHSTIFMVLNYIKKNWNSRLAGCCRDMEMNAYLFFQKAYGPFFCLGHEYRVLVRAYVLPNKREPGKKNSGICARKKRTAGKKTVLSFLSVYRHG